MEESFLLPQREQIKMTRRREFQVPCGEHRGNRVKVRQITDGKR